MNAARFFPRRTSCNLARAAPFDIALSLAAARELRTRASYPMEPCRVVNTERITRSLRNETYRTVNDVGTIIAVVLRFIARSSRLYSMLTIDRECGMTNCSISIVSSQS